MLALPRQIDMSRRFSVDAFFVRAIVLFDADRCRH